MDFKKVLRTTVMFCYLKTRRCYIKLSHIHKGPILVMQLDLKVSSEAVKKLRKNHTGVVGVYPNAGYWEKPAWRFEDQITPEVFRNEAKKWASDGAQIIGGCCGVGSPTNTELKYIMN